MIEILGWWKMIISALKNIINARFSIKNKRIYVFTKRGPKYKKPVQQKLFELVQKLRHVS